jgi:hypothetical protein
MKILKTLKKNIFPTKLSQEALVAYINRLPDTLEVQWFRDGNFIVGTVVADDKKVMTQGMNGDDFIEMVNDAIITVNNIPEDYVDAIRSMKTYSPPAEERAKLFNNGIRHSSISFNKNKEVVQVA